MAERNNENNNGSSIVRWFCGTLIIALLSIMLYFSYVTMVFNASQNRIVQEHTNHIANVDSVFFEMKKIILSSDSGAISNAPELLSQLQRDSALFRRELLLSLEEMSNLTELHLNRLDSNYNLIGVWFGVASVIFLVFGFFGIFKIEENKRDAEKMVAEVKKEAGAVIADIQGKATSLNHIIDNLTQQSETFYAQKEQKFKEFLQNRKNQFAQSVRPLLKEIECKKAELEEMLNNKDRNGGAA